MKIKEFITTIPEMTEEKLLSIMKDNLFMVNKNIIASRIKDLHKDLELQEGFLKEYDLIQDKKSYLTKSQRNAVVGFVGLCAIKMTKDNG